MTVSIIVQRLVNGLLATGGSTTSVDDGGEVASPESVPAAQAATLTTRTGDRAGTLTMTSASHGIVTGQRIDLYWSGGACFGVIAGTVSGTSIPFTQVQGGTVLPAANTAIVVGICESAPFDLTGSNISALICSRATAAVRCYFVFVASLGQLCLAILNQSGQVYVWDGVNPGYIGSASMTDPNTNPLAGTIPTTVWISHADTNAADTGLSTVALKS